MKALLIKTGYKETFRPDLVYSSVSYGDILRSTVILHVLKEYEVHWLTDIKAVPLIFGIKNIKEIHLVNTLDVLGLKTYSWDLIINLESSRGACQLSNELMQPQTKFIGYYLDVKKQKILTKPLYKGINWSEKLFSLFNLRWKNEPYLIPHTNCQIQKNLVFLNKLVGPKLPQKKWDGWDNLEKLLRNNGFNTSEQKSQVIEDFIKEIQKAEFVISTDSLGMHIALALNKIVLGIFGPTDAREVSGLKHYLKGNLPKLKAEKVFKKFMEIKNGYN